jgi:hypothetical protein
MLGILLAAHLIGLMMGAGGGFGSMIVMGAANKAPAEQAMALRRLGPTLARFSLVGLVVMWMTGIALFFMAGGPAAMPLLFWIKLIFVATLTLAALATEFTYAQLKAGNVKAAARLPVLGPIAGLSSLSAVIFAALAFHKGGKPIPTRNKSPLLQRFFGLSVQALEACICSTAFASFYPAFALHLLGRFLDLMGDPL